MKKYYFLAPLIMLLIYYACNSNKNYKQVVLKIGNLEITKYEFNKNKQRGLHLKPDNTIKINSKKFLEWKNEYLNHCYIIADAYEKRYDTINIIQEKVKNTSRIMMVQDYGYLWERTISPIVNKFKIITPAKVEKRKKMFYFDYIRFKDYEGLKKVLGKDTVCRNLTAYNKLKNKCHLFPFMETGYITQQWPFLAFWNLKDYLFEMKEGEISQLISYESNNYYFYLDHIETIEMTEKENNNLQTELTLGLEEEIRKKRENEIDSKCQPVIIYENVDLLAEYLSNNHSIFGFKKNMELLRYKIDYKEKILNFNTFIKYYSYLLLKKEINSKESVLGYLTDYYYDDYLNNEAEKLGLYKTDTFLLDQKNYKNNVIRDKYIQRNIVDKIKIDSAEILKFYNKNLVKFRQPRKIIADIYFFNTLQAAQNNLRILSEQIRKKQTNKNNDTSVFIGLSDFKPNYIIDLEGNKEYSKKFVHDIIALDIGKTSSRPIQFQNKYVLIYKKSSIGEYIMNLKDVYSQIEEQLKYEMIDVKIQELVSELRKEYKVEIDKTGI
jgi:hypothetical protein